MRRMPISFDPVAEKTTAGDHSTATTRVAAGGSLEQCSSMGDRGSVISNLSANQKRRPSIAADSGAQASALVNSDARPPFVHLGGGGVDVFADDDPRAIEPDGQADSPGSAIESLRYLPCFYGEAWKFREACLRRDHLHIKAKVRRHSYLPLNTPLAIPCIAESK